MKNFRRILALILVLVMSVTLVFAFSSCSNDAAESSGDGGDGDGGSKKDSKPSEPVADEQVFDFVKEEVSDGVSDSVRSVYSALKNLSSNSSTGAKGEISFEIGDKTLDFLEQKLNSESGMNLSLDGFEKLAITVDGGMKDSFSQGILAFAIGNTTIISVESVLDLDANQVYMRFPELNAKWLSAPVDMAQMSTFDTDELQAVIDALPSEQVFVSLVEKYMALVWDNLKKSEVSAYTLTVGSTSEDVRRLTVTIDEETIYDVCIAVLGEFVNDETLAKEVKNFMSALYPIITNGYDGGADFETVWGEIWSGAISGAEELLAEAQALKASGEYGNESFPFVVYLNNKNELCGMEYEQDGTKFIEWATAQNDGKFEEKLIIRGSISARVSQYYDEETGRYVEESHREIDELLSITGSGTVSSTINAVYNVSVDGQNVGSVEFVDVAKDGSRGKLNFKLSEQMLVEMLGSSWNQIESAFGMPYIQLEYNNTNTLSNMTLRIMADNDLIVGIGVSAEQKTLTSITVPSSSNVYSFNEMERWAQGISFNKIISNINKTGISQDLKDMLISTLSMASENL